MSYTTTLPPLTDDQRAMVEANTGLIAFVLNRRRTPVSEWDDAFQDGVFGLMRAAQKFDPDRGFQFSTYAVTWIRQAVQKGRGVAEGANYRSAADWYGTEYRPPVSIDAEITTKGAVDSQTLGSYLRDDGPEPDELAVDVLYLEQVEAEARRLCRDRVDSAILDALLSGLPVSEARRDQLVAEALGMTAMGVRYRRRKFQDRLRRRMDVDVGDAR